MGSILSMAFGLYLCHVKMVMGKVVWHFCDTLIGII